MVLPGIASPYPATFRQRTAASVYERSLRIWINIHLNNCHVASFETALLSRGTTISGWYDHLLSHGGRGARGRLRSKSIRGPTDSSRSSRKNPQWNDRSSAVPLCQKPC